MTEPAPEMGLPDVAAMKELERRLSALEQKIQAPPEPAPEGDGKPSRAQKVAALLGGSPAAEPTQ